MAVGGVFLVLTSRGSDDGTPRESGQPARTEAQDPKPEPPSKPEPKEPEKVLAESTCDAGLSNCVVASGRVLYVEAVDPDGDGDAHFVTASSQSVTGPEITIFDVAAGLQPDPLPGVGDLVGGAGPVYPGHAGQKQIQVTEFHVAR